MKEKTRDFIGNLLGYAFITLIILILFGTIFGGFVVVIQERQANKRSRYETMVKLTGHDVTFEEWLVLTSGEQDALLTHTARK